MATNKFHLNLKNYSVDEYEKALDKVAFSNYEKYDINKVCNNFFQKLIVLVNNIAPLKTARIKNASNKWFDSGIAEKLSIRDKLFKKFKSSRLNINWEIYKKQTRKNSILRRNCQKNIAKPKELPN